MGVQSNQPFSVDVIGLPLLESNQSNHILQEPPVPCAPGLAGLTRTSGPGDENEDDENALIQPLGLQPSSQRLSPRPRQGEVVREKGETLGAWHEEFLFPFNFCNE